MKRIVSLFLCMALAVGAVTYKPPKADAIALELSAALIGKVVGVSLISMGMAWVVDQISENMTGQSFGENVAREIQNWLDEEHNCEVIDVFFGGMMPNTSPDPSPTGNVVLTASVAFVTAVAAFGKWLYDKYALADNESAVVYPGTGPVITTVDGVSIVLTTLSDYSSSSVVNLSPVSLGSNLFEVFGIDTSAVGGTSTFRLSENVSLKFDSSNGFNVFYTPGDATIFSSKFSYVSNGYVYPVLIAMPNGKLGYGSYFTSSHPNSGVRGLVSFSSTFQVAPSLLSLTDIGLVESSPALSVSAPNGLNLPDTDSLPEGQGYAVELPETNGAPIQDLNDLMDLVVPIALNNPEYVPTLNPTEITNPDPAPNPDGEEVPEPAPAGATIIDYLVDIWRKIKALPETIGNAVKSAFEPDPELVTEITTTFTDKFGWLETIHQLGLDLCNLKPGSQPPVIYIHLEDATGKYKYGGVEKALDMSWYEPYKADVDHILSGFMWLAFLWLVFKRAAAIIQGDAMVHDDSPDLPVTPIYVPRIESGKRGRKK